MKRLRRAHGLVPAALAGALLLLSCRGAPGPQGSAAFAAEGAADATLALPEVAAECVMRDDVGPADVRWQLRTRSDALPSLRVSRGRVTAWIDGGAEPGAVVRVEHAHVTVQALLAGRPTALVTRAHRVGCCLVPDGLTEHEIDRVAGGRATLVVRFGNWGGDYDDVPCSELGLRRRALPLADAFSPPSGSLFLGPGWAFAGYSGGRPARAAQLEPIFAALRGDRAAPADAEKGAVIVETCQGWLLTAIRSGDILDFDDRRGGCSGTEGLVSDEESPEAELVTCQRSAKLLLRTGSFEDEVGVLGAGARISVRGGGSHGTVAVRVAQAPAQPVASATYALRASDLAACATREGGD